MAGKNQGLETLEVWLGSVDYAVDVCKNVIPNFPSEERWALASQLRRAVQSIPANIAEGYGRYSFQETIHFCYIARGSMAETKTHLLLAYRIGYIDDDMHQKYQSELTELGKMLHGYISHLRKQKRIHSIRETTESNGYDVS